MITLKNVKLSQSMLCICCEIDCKALSGRSQLVRSCRHIKTAVPTHYPKQTTSCEHLYGNASLNCFERRNPSPAVRSNVRRWMALTTPPRESTAKLSWVTFWRRPLGRLSSSSSASSDCAQGYTPFDRLMRCDLMADERESHRPAAPQTTLNSRSHDDERPDRDFDTARPPAVEATHIAVFSAWASLQRATFQR